MKKWMVGIGILMVLLIAGYVLAGLMVRKRVEAALQALPPALRPSYNFLHVNLLSRSVSIGGLRAPGISIERLSARGIEFFAFLRSHRLALASLQLEGCVVAPDGDSMPRLEQPPFTAIAIGKLECTDLKVKLPRRGLSMEGNFALDSVSGPMDSLRFGAVAARADRLQYVIPGSDELLVGRGMDLDSRKKQFRMDTLRVQPMVDRLAMGKKRGHQVDVVESTSEGIRVEGLEVMDLLEHKFTAKRITVDRNHIVVFRDRRLPLAPGEKELPIESLKRLPVTIAVDEADMGTTFFAYEEFPAKGDQPGTLKIYRMRGHIAPLINRSPADDPAYITLKTEGSLMNSGSVTATMKMPLRKGDPYEVTGAFHDLDVTTLNDPAENLGKLRLESGMLNFLSFHFEMDTERSTGKIVGEYHDLVVDKLKDNGSIAGLKSFALKKFIIPRNKDKSLPEKKRTGKVDYKRDPQRYYSYYLLHSLLVGVKSSFSLGFLLPG